MALTGREKATIFLSILGADFSSRVLRYLPDELADIIAAGINHLPTPSPEALSEVLEDFRGFLALPPASASAEASRPAPPAPKKAFSALMTERPQMNAFIISIMTPQEKTEALYSMPRERASVEELLGTLRPTPLKAKLEEKLKEVFAGRVF